MTRIFRVLLVIQLFIVFAEIQTVPARKLGSVLSAVTRALHSYRPAVTPQALSYAQEQIASTFNMLKLTIEFQRGANPTELRKLWEEARGWGRALRTVQEEYREMLVLQDEELRHLRQNAQ